METPYPTFGRIETLVGAVLEPIKFDIPGVTILPYIEGREVFSTPYIEYRREPGAWASDSFAGDYRFSRRALVSIDTFTEDGDDGNGDARGALLQEIVMQYLLRAWRDQTVVTGCGSINRLVVTSPAHRTNDWATGNQVVQYSSLPKGMHRYESTVGLDISPDRTNPPDLLALF